jgi:hypothetical protein
MNARILLRVLAAYYAVPLGVVWLAVPGSGLGHDHGANAVFVARALGADLVIIGLLNWLTSSQPTALIRKVMWANVLMNVIPVILGTVNVLNGSFGTSGWVGVGAHAIPLAALLLWLTASKSDRKSATPASPAGPHPGATLPPLALTATSPAATGQSPAITVRSARTCGVVR